MFEDPEHLPTFILISMIFALSGLLVGVAIDKWFKKLSDKYPKQKFAIAFVQLLILVTIVAIIFKYLQRDFALHFQKTLPGMAFPAMYFGVQSNIFEIAHQITMIKF